MRCFVCQLGPMHDVTVFRVNATGQKGVWACEQHIKRTDATIDPEVKAITEVFESKPMSDESETR